MLICTNPLLKSRIINFISVAKHQPIAEKCLRLTQYKKHAKKPRLTVDGTVTVKKPTHPAVR